MERRDAVQPRSPGVSPGRRIRCLAYQVLLLDDPTPDYGNALSSFVASGLSFLNQQSIEAIANSRFEKRQLEALRRSLLRFRNEMDWPADEVTRNQFRDIFHLLINFVENHPEFYSPVRAELAIWSLQTSDPALAHSARTCRRNCAGVSKLTPPRRHRRGAGAIGRRGWYSTTRCRFGAPPNQETSERNPVPAALDHAGIRGDRFFHRRRGARRNLGFQEWIPGNPPMLSRQRQSANRQALRSRAHPGRESAEPSRGRDVVLVAGNRGPSLWPA